MSIGHAIIARAGRRAAVIEDYAYLRDFGLTIEQAAAYLGITYKTAHDRFEPFRRDVPPWPPREHPPANPGRHCGTRLGYMFHQVWREDTCPACRMAGYPADCGTVTGWQVHADREEPACRACLLARYPGLLGENIPAGLDLVAEVEPPAAPAPAAASPAVPSLPPVTAEEAAGHLAALAEAIGEPVPAGAGLAA